MNTVYHISAPTYEDFKLILNRMERDLDPALCCANVVWRPSGLADYYKSFGREGQPLGKVFQNIGVQRASEMFFALTKKGISPKTAWAEIYAKECAKRNEAVA